MNSQAGATLSEVLVSVTIIAMTSIGAGTIASSVTKFDGKDRLMRTALDLRSQASEVLSQKKMWSDVVTNAGKNHPTTPGQTLNSSLACVRDGTACPDVTSPLAIRDRTGRFITDPAQPTLGFTRDGAACTTYGLQANRTCVVRLEASWRPSCPLNGPCVNPLVLIELRVLTITSSDGQPLLSGKNLVSHITAEDYDPAFEAPALQSFYTNAIGVGGTTDVTIDLATIMPQGGVSFSLPAAASNQGGTLTITGSSVTYSPANAFRGVDRFTYTATRNGEVVQGDVRINVMTPYTWVGDGGSASPAWAPSGRNAYAFVTDIRNWCGTVISNACSHTNVNIAGGATINYGAAELVFNDTCYGQHCTDVWLNMGNSGTSAAPGTNIVVGAIDVARTWSGKIWVGATGVTSITRAGGGHLRIFGGTFDALSQADGDTAAMQGLDVRGLIELSGTATLIAPRNYLYAHRFSQTGGTFEGGSAVDIAIGSQYALPSGSSAGSLAISGGLFKSTTGYLSLQNAHFTVTSPAYFQHRNGTFRYRVRCCEVASGVARFAIDGLTFNQAEFRGDAGGQVDYLNSRVTILGRLTLDSDNWNCHPNDAHNANIYAKGDINVIGHGWSGSNTTLYVDGQTQMITAGRFTNANNWTGYPCTAGYLPKTVFQSTNRATLDGDFHIGYGLVHLQGGLVTTNSTVYVGMWNGTIPLHANNQTFHNLILGGDMAVFDLGGQVANVSNELSFAGLNWNTGIPSVVNGTFNAYRNIATHGNGVGGTAVINVLGNAAQITGGTDTGRQYALPFLNLNSAGNVTFRDRVGITAGLTHTAGTIAFGGSTVMRVDDRYPSTLTLGSMVFHHFSFRTGASTNLNGGILKIDGNLEIPAVSPIMNGSIELRGNLNATGGFADGSTGATIRFVGGNLQDVYIPGSWPTTTFPHFIIDKSGDCVHLISPVPVNGSRRIERITINAGNDFNMMGNALWVTNGIQNSGGLYRGSNPSCGTLTATVTGNAATCP